MCEFCLLLSADGDPNQNREGTEVSWSRVRKLAEVASESPPSQTSFLLYKHDPLCSNPLNTNHLY